MQRGRHDAFVQGISTGSWLPKAKPKPVGVVQLQNARRAGPPLVGIRPQIVRPFRSPPKRRPPIGTFWLDRGESSLGLSHRRWALLIGVVFTIALLGTLSILEFFGTINLIPPDRYPPPNPFPPPMPPLAPPPSLPPPQPPEPPNPPATPPPPPYPPNYVIKSSSTCHHTLAGHVIPLVKNGRCEDGGDGSVANICELGTDFPDCPERVT